uniref:Uncharacterized protein n=1 Tax=Meloidogyne hapla TaxID=6305 RepID=A0A1I8BF61_MELHA
MGGCAERPMFGISACQVQLSWYQDTADQSLALERMVRHQALWNFIYDNRKFNNTEDEDDPEIEKEVMNCETDKENADTSNIQ